MTTPVTLCARLDAPVAAVREALTDPVAVRRWLAEFAEVDLPGRYEFWGRYTPQGGEPHQRVLHADDRTLRLGWVLDGRETVVEIGLAPATVLTLSQTWFEGQDVGAGHPINLFLTVHWSLAIANLADHLAGREPTPGCDFTATDLRTRVLINAPREEVFAAMTDPARFSRWFGLTVEIEPYAGGIWAIRGGGPLGSVAEVEPGHRLSLREDSGLATWDLTDAEDGTWLDFTMTDHGAEPYASWTGWLAAISALRRYLELDDWQALWIHNE
jgi:uncharacterized protein YndB with AHSA1/START domain